MLINFVLWFVKNGFHLFGFIWLLDVVTRLPFLDGKLSDKMLLGLALGIVVIYFVCKWMWNVSSTYGKGDFAELFERIQPFSDAISVLAILYYALRYGASKGITIFSTIIIPFSTFRDIPISIFGIGCVILYIPIYLICKYKWEYA